MTTVSYLRGAELSGCAQGFENMLLWRGFGEERDPQWGRVAPRRGWNCGFKGCLVDFRIAQPPARVPCAACHPIQANVPKGRDQHTAMTRLEEVLPSHVKYDDVKATVDWVHDGEEAGVLQFSSHLELGKCCCSCAAKLSMPRTCPACLHACPGGYFDLARLDLAAPLLLPTLL